MEKTNLSVGFADLTHYAKLMDAVGAEKAIEILQDAFKFAGDIIVKHNGKIRKYIGDAVLFTFNDPKQAISAAKEIAGGYKKDIESLTVQFSISIATGEVFFCKIGHPSYTVEDIIGTTVNTAGKLMKEATHSEPKIALCNETKKYI